jgi:hypothetical protein
MTEPIFEGGASGGLQNLVVVLIYIPQSQDHRSTSSSDKMSGGRKRPGRAM